MLLYVFINVVIAVIGIIAVLYLLFRLFAWRQGDARFVIEARRRAPFALKELTTDTAVFETEVPFYNGGRQLGTIMDFYPRTLLVNSMTNASFIHSLPIKMLNEMTTIGNPSFIILVTMVKSVLRLHWSAKIILFAKT